MKLATQTWERGYKATAAQAGELLQPPFFTSVCSAHLPLLFAGTGANHGSATQPFPKPHATSCTLTPSYEVLQESFCDLIAVTAYIPAARYIHEREGLNR